MFTIGRSYTRTLPEALLTLALASEPRVVNVGAAATPGVAEGLTRPLAHVEVPAINTAAAVGARDSSGTTVSERLSLLTRIVICREQAIL